MMGHQQQPLRLSCSQLEEHCSQQWSSSQIQAGLHLCCRPFQRLAVLSVLRLRDRSRSLQKRRSRLKPGSALLPLFLLARTVAAVLVAFTKPPSLVAALLPRAAAALQTAVIDSSGAAVQSSARRTTAVSASRLLSLLFNFARRLSRLLIASRLLGHQRQFRHRRVFWKTCPEPNAVRPDWLATRSESTGSSHRQVRRSCRGCPLHSVQHLTPDPDQRLFRRRARLHPHRLQRRPLWSGSGSARRSTFPLGVSGNS